ncbi:diguanylate cyclase (GGDEF) domain-containing protein [Modicisalibacter muralis]|uniref:Diguanylate cyclase (GGDEF) domain-containing protein n=1 Tax=Modicisalibacter muralis TaxID=119000 RepID=A0A1G9LJC2_9GAMM|nr:diguanylate cyclase [Halomonas muralis]SDL61938.1 diguanylate cyclase (GGDEF) domain-containing protein [Halomonas muralis]
MDGLKTLNDDLGHQVGDELLCNVANAMCGSARDTDTVARVGGNELVIALAEMPTRDAVAGIGAKVLTAVAAISVGGCKCPRA